MKKRLHIMTRPLGVKLGILATLAFVVGLAFAHPANARPPLCQSGFTANLPGEFVVCLAPSSCNDFACYQTTCDSANCPLPDGNYYDECWFCNLADRPVKNPT